MDNRFKNAFTGYTAPRHKNSEAALRHICKKHLKNLSTTIVAGAPMPPRP